MSVDPQGEAAEKWVAVALNHANSTFAWPGPQPNLEGTDHERTTAMTVDRGLLLRLGAKPDKGDELTDFLNVVAKRLG